MAAGGDAVARDDEGRVVFVAGGLPDELVEADVTEERSDFARAVVLEVLEPSPDRVAPPCPQLARGCGGCGWQHVAVPAQRVFKHQIVADALRRAGGVATPHVEAGPELAAVGYRTTVRLAVEAGRAGFRRHHGHDVVAVDDCLVAHPLLSELLAVGDFSDAAEVTLRCGARTGERLAVADPTAAGLRLPDDEEVAGVRLRVSARSFFQARPDGADALVEAVRSAIADAPPGRLVDAYGGVGLFAATVAGDRAVTLLERSPSSLADARVNVPGARVLRVDVDRWHPSPAAVVVADPARAGLGKRAAAALAGTGAATLVLVSCDPASLGRDTALLRRHGFEHDRSVVVDLFGHTPHIEVVTRFIRSGLTDIGVGTV
jgi:23S rRNA (uracil1939-C5)-methyltransferase